MADQQVFRELVARLRLDGSRGVADLENFVHEVRTRLTREPAHPIKLNTAPAVASVQELKAKLHAMSNEKINIGAKTDELKVEIEYSKRAIAELSAHRGHGVQIHLQLEELKTNIREAEAELMRLKGRKVDLNVSTVKTREQLKEFEVAMHRTTTSTHNQSNALKLMEHAAQGATKAMEHTARVGETVGRLGLKSTGGGGGIFTGIGGLLAVGGVLAIPAAGAGILEFFDGLSKKVADYSSAVLLGSQRTGIATDQFQGLSRAAEQLGVTPDRLTFAFTRFNSQLAKGGASLKAIGIDLNQLGITSHDTATAFGQLADYIAKHNNAMENAALAQAFFGRGGAQLLPLLKQGSAFFAEYTAEMRKYGLVLSDADLNAGALSATIRDQFGLAIQGVQFQIGTQLETAFNTLYLTMIKSLGGGEAAFKKIGEVIGHVVGWISSLLGGFFHVTVTAADVAEALNSPTAKLKGMAAAAGIAGDTTEALAMNTAEATKQLDISTKATDARYDAENRVIDSMIKQLDLQEQARDAARTAADDQKAITKDKIALSEALFSGDTVKSKAAGEQMTTDVQKQAENQRKVTANSQKTQLQAQKDANNEAKRSFDELQADKKQKLQDLTTAFQQNMDGASSATSKGMAAMTKNMNDYIAKGDETARKIGLALSNPFNDVNRAYLATVALAVGTAVGKALVNGVVGGLAGLIGSTGGTFLDFIGAVGSFLSGDLSGGLKKMNDLQAKIRAQAAVNLEIPKYPGETKTPMPVGGNVTGDRDLLSGASSGPGAGAPGFRNSAYAPPSVLGAYKGASYAGGGVAAAGSNRSLHIGALVVQGASDPEVTARLVARRLAALA